jgi:SAM-dependent methyltransferase
MPEDYGPSTYGDRIAQRYDEWFSVPGDAEWAVEFLQYWAGPGPALELGIGTGRIALPLAARGVEIQGIDASEAMVSKLREKPGGTDIDVTFGDFAEVAVDGTFRLIYVVFNTFFALLSQEDQVRCFANVAAHLTEDGAFVIQAFVPDVTLYDRGTRVAPQFIGVDSVVVDIGELDMAEQRITAQHVVLEHGSVTMYPVRLRFAFPAELDLMATLAGLRLRQRFAGWRGEPFNASSGQHVSVYERAP